MVKIQLLVLLVYAYPGSRASCLLLATPKTGPRDVPRCAWGSEFTIKVATLEGNSDDFAAERNAKF